MLWGNARRRGVRRALCRAPRIYQLKGGRGVVVLGVVLIAVDVLTAEAGGGDMARSAQS